MNSLREICEFVGASGPNKFVVSEEANGALNPDPGMGWIASYVPAFPFDAPKASMRWIGIMVPVLSAGEQTSMRSMISGLRALSSFTLDADAANTHGEVPLTVTIHVHSCVGVILETSIALFEGGQHLHLIMHKNFGSSDGVLQMNFDTGPGPGAYTFVVRRVGITNAGITTLTKSFDVIARAKPDPVPPTIDPVPPAISVQQSAMTGGGFVVSGKGFLGKHPVNILVGDGTLRQPVVFTVTSEPDGSFNGFQTGNLCQNRIDQFGQPSKRFFEASDGRLKPSDGSQLFSNTVEISCPA